MRALNIASALVATATLPYERSLIRTASKKARSFWKRCPIIVLDIQGKETSSEALASQIERYTVEGVSHLVFVIGGSDGLTNAVKERASLRMSFGPITLPHNLARVVLLEQVYRAFKIIKREPYHK